MKLKMNHKLIQKFDPCMNKICVCVCVCACVRAREHACVLEGLV